MLRSYDRNGKGTIICSWHHWAWSGLGWRSERQVAQCESWWYHQCGQHHCGFVECVGEMCVIGSRFDEYFPEERAGWGGRGRVLERGSQLAVIHPPRGARWPSRISMKSCVFSDVVHRFAESSRDRGYLCRSQCTPSYAALGNAKYVTGSSAPFHVI